MQKSSGRCCERRGPDIATPPDDNAVDSGSALPGPDVVRVQIWQSGQRLASGQAADSDRAMAVRRAASRAAVDLRAREGVALDDTSAYLVIEAIQGFERIDPDGLSGLIASVQPGVHGLLFARWRQGRG